MTFQLIGLKSKMVSVLEINDVKEVPENILKEIFIKQQSLIDKYIEIEGMGDLMNKTKTNLDTLEGQVWIKDFIYRSIEEVGESFEVIRNMDSWDSLPEKLKIHYCEEIIDALHFFIEMCIICGYTYEDFNLRDIHRFNFYYNSGQYKCDHDDFVLRHWSYIESITLAGNCLRNKKWKKTQMLTDRNKFKEYLDEAFFNLLQIVCAVGMDKKGIYNLYFKKNEVNKFRQNSGY